MFARPAYWWIGGGILAVVVSSLGITTSWSYLKTAWRSVGQSIRDATPIQFELQRLETMLQDLQPEIRRNLQVVAQLEVEVEYLEKEIDTLKKDQEKLLAQIRTLRDELASDKQDFVFAGQKFSRPEVEKDLSRRLDVYEERETVLAAKMDLLTQKRRTLENARAKVSEYRSAYDGLVQKAESLRAQLQLVEAAAAAGNIEVDSSKLAAARELARDIEIRLETTRRMLDSSRVASGEIPVEGQPESVLDRADRVLGNQPAQGKQAPET
jgi:cell division protein FtsB